MVKRDLAQDSVHSENKLEDTNKFVGIVQNDNVVSQNSGNQTKLRDIEVNNQASQELPQSKEYSLDERTFLVNHSKPLLEKSPNLGESIKIRDLKSNARQKEKETSSQLSSRSIQSLLSKQRSKRSRRSRLQVTNVWFGLVLLTTIKVEPRAAHKLLYSVLCSRQGVFVV